MGANCSIQPQRAKELPSGQEVGREDNETRKSFDTVYIMERILVANRVTEKNRAKVERKFAIEE